MRGILLYELVQLAPVKLLIFSCRVEDVAVRVPGEIVGVNVS